MYGVLALIMVSSLMSCRLYLVDNMTHIRSIDRLVECSGGVDGHTVFLMPL